MDKRDFWYIQTVTDGDLDALQNLIDAAIKRFIKVGMPRGIVEGYDTTETSPESFNVEVGQGLAFDKDGERLYNSGTATVDCSEDENGDPTYSDLGVGEKRWISVFAHFTRAQSDPHVDGKGETVYYQQNESLAFRVVRGSIAADPQRDVEGPGLDASDILVADILMYYGMTEVDDTDIYTDRAEENFGRLRLRKTTGHDNPDEHEIAKEWGGQGSLVVLSDIRKTGSVVSELRDRNHARIPTRLFEFDDDFITPGLISWWSESDSGSQLAKLTNYSFPWGAYEIQLESGGATPWWKLVTDFRFLSEDDPVVEWHAYMGDAADTVQTVYLGAIDAADTTHELTDEGFGFYCKNGNWIARCHDGTSYTDVDTGVTAAGSVQVLRAHLLTLADGTPKKVVFYVDGALVATITSNLPSGTTLLTAFVKFLTESAPAKEYNLVVDRCYITGKRSYGHA